MNDIIGRQELADMLGITVRELDKAIASGQAPPQIEGTGFVPRWSVSFVNDWMEEQRNIQREKGDQK